MLHEEYMDDAAVKESILAEVDDKFDKRDGTLPDMVAGMVAPAIANIFITMAIDADESNASTASYAGLAQKIKERGLTLYPATKATFKAVALPNTLEIPTGTRLTLEGNDNLIYNVISKLDNVTISGAEYAAFEIELQIEGADYNSINSGRLLFIDNDVDGCTSININGILVAGEDMEGEENARNRYFESFDDKRYGGNIVDYKSLVTALAGIGGCRVYRPNEWTHETGFNMKISCVSSSITSISAELVASTQETVYPIVDGDGRGLAPIGHKPKIVSVTEIPINLILDLEYLDGYDFTSVSAGITSNITTFLRNLAATWKDDDEQNSHPCLVVRIANLISQISAVEGVQDINGITINQEKENTNLTLGTDDIPIMGTITEAVN